MNRFRPLKTIVILLLAATTMQCQSSTESDPQPTTIKKTATELLTGKNWKLRAATVDPAYDYYGMQRTITNIYAYMPQCSRDNLERYEVPNRFIVDEGADVCGAGSYQFRGPFQWEFGNNEMVLIQRLAPYSDQTYTIEKLTEDQLVLVQKKISVDQEYTYRFEYLRQ